MYKWLTIILLVVSLALAGLFVHQYQQNRNIKQSMLGQYVIAQHNISGYLNDAVEHNLAGNNNDFIISLQNTACEFRTIDSIIAPGSTLGQYINTSDLMYTIHADQMNFINESLDKALSDRLTEEDLNKIFAFAEAMEHYAGLLNYNTLVPGNSPNQIISSINDKLEETSQLYSGYVFNQ